jgi:sugar lactone lactonase YvrE
VRPRTVIITMVLIVAVAAAAVWYFVREGQPEGRVQLAELSEDTTATVGLAGVFPSPERTPLANPLGVAWDGDRLFVAESDAGTIRVFDDRGGELGLIRLPLAKDIASVYPSALALVGDDRLAVVDNAASRVIVVSREPAEKAKVLLTLGGKTPPLQPTSLAYGAGEYFVFDASIGAVQVYDDAGARVRTIGADLQPRIVFASGMCLVDGVLYLADSNAGRIVAIDSADGAQRAVFPDRYSLPRSVAPMSDGRLAIVDTFERAVYITDDSGVRLDAISEKTLPDAFPSSPRGAAWVAESGRLYVTDATAGALLVYNVRAAVK